MKIKNQLTTWPCKEWVCEVSYKDRKKRKKAEEEKKNSSYFFLLPGIYTTFFKRKDLMSTVGGV